jgi:hypothetical protein
MTPIKECQAPDRELITLEDSKNCNDISNAENPCFRAG